MSKERRSYDEDLERRKARLGYRVDEPEPHCWMCSEADSPRSNEHIFPQWLLGVLGLSGRSVSPTHYGADGKLISDRGQFPVSNLVNGQVCERCNNGWMADLEAEFKSLFERPRLGRLDQRDRQTIARWFAKTAVVLNTSQNYRTLYPSGVRHQLPRRVPANVQVWLALRPPEREPVVTWVQTSGAMFGITHGEAAALAFAQRAERWHVAVVEAGPLVGLVTYTPGGAVWPTDEWAELWPAVKPLYWEMVPTVDTPAHLMGMMATEPINGVTPVDGHLL